VLLPERCVVKGFFWHFLSQYHDQIKSFHHLQKITFREN
jgi:hypothetical protein